MKKIINIKSTGPVSWKKCDQCNKYSSTLVKFDESDFCFSCLYKLINDLEIEEIDQIVWQLNLHIQTLMEEESYLRVFLVEFKGRLKNEKTI